VRSLLDRRLDADDAEDGDSSVETADVQLTSLDVEAHPTRLSERRAAQQVTHVDEVRVEQNDSVIVAIEQQHVAEHVDGNALR